MVSMAVYQISYLRQREELRDEARVIAWLEALAAEGYSLTKGEEAFEERDAQGLLHTHSQPLGCSSRAREAAHRFCTGNAEELDCTASALLEDFTVGVSLFEPEGSVMVTADDRHFTTGELSRQYYQWFLTLVEVTYRQWHPVYGFAHEGAACGPLPSREEALSLEVRRLFTINLFGPEYVARLGRKAVLSTPAWQVRELDDGGVLVVPVPYVKEDWRQPSPYDLGSVAEHLGFSL